MSALLVQVGSTAIPLAATVEREGVGGVTGLTTAQVTVALRNTTTLNSYLDFSDNTFKTVGWVTKYAGLSEVERGHYQRSFNSSLVAVVVDGTILAAEFHVDNGAGVIGDDLDLLIFSTSAGFLEHRAASSFAFNPNTGVLDGNAWLELEGVLIPAVTSLTANFYNSAGALLFSLTDVAPDAQGIFRISSTPFPPGFTVGALVYVRLTIVAPSGTFVGVKGLQVVG
jgi:hypothetical protein